MKKKFALALACLALSLAISTPSAAQKTDERLKQQLFGRTQEKLNQAKAAQGDVLSPDTFARASKRFSEAQEYFKRGRGIGDIDKKLREAEADFERVMQNVKIAEVTFASVLQARADALKANASRFVPEEYTKGDKYLKEAARKLEDGYVDEAKKNAKEAALYFRNAEAKTADARISRLLGFPADVDTKPLVDAKPPTITLTEPAGAVLRSTGMRGIQIEPVSEKSITLRGTVEDDNAVAGLSINDKNIPLGGTPTRATFAASVPVPSAGSSLSLTFVATDKAGNTTREIYEITVEVPAPTVMLDFKTDPAVGKYWALVIGVSDYNHPSITDLDFAVADAKEIAGILAQYYTFDLARTKLLSNPTRSELIGALSAFSPTGQTSLDDEDNLLVFYAGHGHWDENYEEGYWLPSDGERNNRANWVSNSDIQKAFKAIKARHILLISDACFSGSLFATREPFSAAIEEAYKESSRKAITAGNLAKVPDQSVFKRYLVKRLKENAKRYLDAGELFNSLKEAVTNNSPTRQRPLYGVIQQTGDEGGEFIFVKRN